MWLLYLNSFFFNFPFAVPDLPSNLQLCGKELPALTNSTEICIRWGKPTGGNAITDYFLEWTSESIQSSESHVEKHKLETQIFSFIIKNLMKGEKINITINSRNSAGLSGAAELNVAASK